MVRYFKPLVYKEKPGRFIGPAFLFSARRQLAGRSDGNKKAVATRSVAGFSLSGSP